tara:strand:- start:140 stop:1912 length:1773 start_codon:yes stop_codon:yes gene_type:complete
MKILRLLSKKYLSFFLILFLCVKSFADDKPVDIWNINEDKKKEESSSTLSTDENKKNSIEQNESSIYKMQSQKQSDEIQLDKTLLSEEIKITGLYDPEDYGLDIYMWTNSDGNQLKKLFNRLSKIKLSNDATELMNISILTNAYYPQKNITEKEFLKLKSDWLIKNSDLNLIEEYLIKNQIFDENSKLSRFLVDEYLSQFEIDKACEIFSKNLKPINDIYLSKFNIYCLISSGKKNEAQLNLDLKKELGFKEKYFEKKIDYLLGFTSEVHEGISEKSILDFHLAHITNPNFTFEPKENTNKIIWKYLSSANLLGAFKEIDTSQLDKIANIEKAVHNKNYPEKDLFLLYKRFQFNIIQLLNVQENYKTLSNIEARALIYQKILLESEMIEKLKLLKILKSSFENDNIANAFDLELKEFLKEYNPTEIPDNLTSFYYTNIKIGSNTKKKIKFNNDIMHQSKLINYFNGDYAKSKIEKDVDNFLKKIKKNKKYFFSKKDIIFLESLKSDGIQISDKYNNLYQINESEIPTDIQVMINNNEKGAALLRIIEVIGQDKLDRIDEDTIYFIISTLNKLNIDQIRNKILLKVLPLKV